jgi:periplasmic copper chaperone A
MKSTWHLFSAIGISTWLCTGALLAATLNAGVKAPDVVLSWGPTKIASQQSYRLGQLIIEAPWARATPGGAQVGSGYLKITNTGKESDVLIGGSLAVATSVEVHEMSAVGGVMKMRMLEKGLEIKPGTSVELKPGSYHLMFTGLREGLTQGQSVKGTLTFQKAGSIEVEYLVAPVGAQSSGHSHR